MAKWAWLGAAVCVAAFGGCQHQVYEVEMTVEGNQIVRSFSTHFEGSGPGGLLVSAVAPDPNAMPASRPAPAPSTRVVASTSRLAGRDGNGPSSSWGAIARMYKVDPNAPEPWKGRFAGRTPDDVGGAGSVAFFPSDMGSAWIYLERFRGDGDPASTLEGRLRSADTIASVVAGWARARLGDRNGFDKLGAYLDGDYHQDLRNFTLLLWTAGAARHMSMPQATDPNALAMRGPFLLSSAQLDVAAIALQYLVERKYVDLEDAPTVMRYFGGASDEEKSAIVKDLWRKILTRKIGLTDKELIERLVGIVDRSEEVSKSLESYVETCKEYKEYLAQPRPTSSSEDPPGWNEPSVEGFLARLSYVFIAPGGINILGVDDELRLTLETKEAPILTNGAWDANAKKVSWLRQFMREAPLVKDPLPAICFAVWARPDDGFQTKHFGRTILRGQSLVGYCLWRRGLTAAEGKQWDAVVAAVDPGTDLGALARSAAEQAATQPAASGSAHDVVVEGLRMLEAALKD